MVMEERSDVDARPRLGARPVGPETTEFRVWAPHASALAVRPVGADDTPGEGGDRELERGADGVFAGVLPLAAGTDYRLVLDGPARSPTRARAGSRTACAGPSRVLDTDAFGWTDDGWPGVSLADLVIYELHVGTFTAAAPSTRSSRELAELARLGVTAIELMPVATFPGERGWGYDGVYTSAPHPRLRRAAGLRPARRRRPRDGPRRDPRRRLQPHRPRLGGPVARSVRTSPTATTPSGATRIDYSLDRRCASGRSRTPSCGSRDYHIDGLRLDAMHAIFDDRATARAGRARDRVRRSSPARSSSPRWRSATCGRSRSGATTRSGRTSCTTRCTCCSPASTRATTSRYGKVADLARELERPQARAARGLRAEPRPGRQPRVRRPAAGRRAAARGRSAPSCRAGTPLLFMGEEYGEHAPVPVLHRPRRPGDRRGDARGSPQGVRASSRPSRARTSPTRRRRDVRALEARSAVRRSRAPAPTTRPCCALRRRAARRAVRDRGRRGPAPAARPPRRLASS